MLTVNENIQNLIPFTSFSPEGKKTYVKEDHDLLKQIMENNKQVIKNKTSTNPNFYKNLAKGQHPKVLFIGCSDSRIPVSVTGLDAGDIFVHRNIANVVLKNDLNSGSVIQYAVEHLKVEYIIVCGHTHCGGVAASLEDEELGFMGGWINNIKNVYRQHEHDLKKLSDYDKKTALSELNTVQSVFNIVSNPVITEAWSKGQKLSVLGWMYEIETGKLRELDCRFESLDDIKKMKK
ncbi:carbonic anhydrase [Anaeromyces robustus]|jgi:carbonic anhydrase|uniref:Carbonic anhydrase n=1 Tax=Anaeromyces robustus TaxID=1754192 RepID=A0A1Y1XGQ3_9FUNG|nr:carbonic anhydrase [Anaeromyces robustus]|eukprot:ORX84939.1 carbonic anhydrase [Anaeromyces robustus]